MEQRARMVLWWEHPPPTNVTRGSIPGLGVSCGSSLLLVLFSAPWGFSPRTPVFSSPKNQHFYIPILSGMLARLLLEPVVRDIGQPLLKLLSLKIDLIWFDPDFVVLFIQSSFCLFDMLEIKLYADAECFYQSSLEVTSVISWTQLLKARLS